MHCYKKLSLPANITRWQTTEKITQTKEDITYKHISKQYLETKTLLLLL
jgi:hypothetical protein